MVRGRKKKPKQIKILEGNRSKVNLAAMPDEPRPNGPLRMPKALSGEALRLWMDTVQCMPDGLYSRADEGMLERFALAWARFREAQRKIDATGMLIQSPQGPVRNPYLLIQDQAAKEMHRTGGELGLSPVSRARLTAPGDGDDDPMAQLLGMDDDPDGAWATVPKTRQ